MLDLSQDSMRVLVVLLPGFVSLKIKEFFLAPRQPAQFDRLLEVVAFAVVNYMVAATGMSLLRAPNWVGIVDVGLLSRSGPLLPFLYTLGLFSLVTGLAAGVVVGRDYHYRLARKLGLTNRTGREDVWQDTFSDFTGNWLVVHTADERRVEGWAQFYSDRGERPSLFLRQAAWVEDDGTLTPVSGDGVLVCEAATIRYIEFLGTGGSSEDQAERQRPGADAGDSGADDSSRRDRPGAEGVRSTESGAQAGPEARSEAGQ